MPVAMVDRDGVWHFVPANADRPGDVEVPLMQMVSLNPDLVEIAGLQPGSWVQRDGELWSST